jgi:hypothetical protein
MWLAPIDRTKHNAAHRGRDTSFCEDGKHD